ncbi:MAG TPA: hypothetical protein VIL36_09625 [Acidimicrobiales bacterium]
MSGGLRAYLNLFTLAALPPASSGPHALLRDPRALLAALSAAGYEGVQGYEIEIAGLPAADPALCAELGMGCTTAGRVLRPGTIDRDAARWADRGYEAATLHVGRGHEDDATAHRLLDEVVAAADRHGIPLYVETHRGTLTQDTWRTVRLVEAHPELRFNGDFSHWYTGLELTYGDFDERLRFLAPVLERTRFLHGRIGDPGCIQVDVGDGDPEAHPSVADFEALWTAAFRGFLATAGPGEHVVFAPELLPPQVHYARTVPTPEGRAEESDRWEQALVLTRIARRCWDRARAEVEVDPVGPDDDPGRPDGVEAQARPATAPVESGET